MKTEEKAKKVQNIATALAAIFGAVGAFFGIFQAQMSANLKNQVTSLQNASQQTIVNVISTLGDDAQAADLAQSGDTVAITEQLIRLYAKQLKIPSFAEYQEVLRQADPSAGFSDLLLELMKAETASRQENQNRRRLKAAGFPYLKTMEEFDYSQLNDAVSPLFLQELASCQFIQNRQNVIMIGNPGRGKTHLAIALGLKACTQGYNVLFKNAATLSTELCEAKDNYHLGKLERTLAKADLLILDELSYLSFNRHQSELLFKVISDRSEKSSTIVTTNLPFSKWTDLFENTTMVTALIDRLTFRSHVLDMNGDSYRLKATMQNKA